MGIKVGPFRMNNLVDLDLPSSRFVAAAWHHCDTLRFVSMHAC